MNMPTATAADTAAEMIDVAVRAPLKDRKRAANPSVKLYPEICALGACPQCASRLNVSGMDESKLSRATAPGAGARQTGTAYRAARERNVF
jgi:hypothetical protein